ncbi:UNVERIFIED_CONTAM: hypothetical protein OHV15_17245 [Microbacterium sp. SLM126]
MRDGLVEQQPAQALAAEILEEKDRDLGRGAVSKHLVAQTQRIVQSAEINSKINSQGLHPLSVPLASFQQSESTKWGAAVRATGITIE